MGLPVARPQAGHVSCKVYRPHARHFLRTDRMDTPQSLRWNFTSPPFASRTFATRATAFCISSSAVL